MKDIKVLIWMNMCWPYLNGILKGVEQKFGIICKDIVDFGLPYVSYNSQVDFDNVLLEYMPDIIILYQVTSRNLYIDIPENIKVISYYDHFIEEFCLFGKCSFLFIPKNNYIFIPILDPENIDIDKVLRDSSVKKKLFFAPFLPWINEGQEKEFIKDCDKYICDLSIISNYKGIDYYYGVFHVYENKFSGRMLIKILGELINRVRKEIKSIESANIEDKKIQEIIGSVLEISKIRQYVRNEHIFIKYWFNALKYIIIPHEYGNFVIDWLIEAGYNLKIYGEGWKKEPKYERYAFGAIGEGEKELCNVYRYSKINIGNNPIMGIHRRNFEAVENECLCFQAEAAPDWYASDYHHYFEEDKSIVVYRNKKELYDKIDFYLSHDEECKKIKAAAKKALNKCPDVIDIFGNIVNEVYKKE